MVENFLLSIKQDHALGSSLPPDPSTTCRQKRLRVVTVENYFVRQKSRGGRSFFAEAVEGVWHSPAATLCEDSLRFS